MNKACIFKLIVNAIAQKSEGNELFQTRIAGFDLTFKYAANIFT